MGWTPSAATVESQLRPYGPAASSAPTPPPSTVNCTPATPALSDAVAPSAWAPDTDVPSAGAVSAIVGATLSPGRMPLTVSVTGTTVVGLSDPGAEIVRFPL